MEIERNVGDGAAMGDAVHVDAGNDEGGCVSRRATRFQALLDRALTESFAPEPVVAAKEGDDTLGDSTLLRNLTTHMLRAVHDNVKVDGSDALLCNPECSCCTAVRDRTHRNIMLVAFQTAEIGPAGGSSTCSDGWPPRVRYRRVVLLGVFLTIAL